MNGTWKAIVKYRAVNLIIRETELFSMALKWSHIPSFGTLELEGTEAKEMVWQHSGNETQRGRHLPKLSQQQINGRIRARIPVS